MPEPEVPNALNFFEARDLVGDGDAEVVCTVILDPASDEPRECGEVICTVEYGDTLLVLAITALDHYKEHHA